MSKDPGHSDSKADRQGSQIRALKAEIAEKDLEIEKLRQALSIIQTQAFWALPFPKEGDENERD